MSAIWAIASKELRLFLTTWTSYVLAAVFCLLGAFFFYILVRDFWELRNHYLEMRATGMLEQLNLTDLVVGPLFSYLSMVLTFILPIVTMRLVAEERRSQTLELLVTCPVSPWSVVLGKYLAALILTGFMLLLTLPFPSSLEMLSAGEGAIDWQTVATAYLGLFLFCAAGLAIGLFASAVTESQIIAVVIGFGLLLCLVVIGAAARGQHGLWYELFSQLSATNHLRAFARGLVRPIDISYFLSVSLLGVFFSFRSLEALRWR